MIFLYVLLILLLIAVWAYLATLMKRVATLKGYGDDIHAWAICFWLGIFGYLYIIALPDKVMQSQNQQMIELLKNKGEK